MGKKLIIVESPSKAKHIQPMLGSGYQVMASVGHVVDLPKKKMGVSAPKYNPEYDIVKPDVVKRIRAAAKEADEVILATDPDREGEAIAWHLQTLLKIKDAKRITYGEVTKKAILEALAKPRKINMKLVRAQEARRVLDRLTGYRVSPVLSDMAGMKLSAGRVQTPGVVLVVQREREIRNFVSTTHYGVLARFAQAGKEWSAAWDFKPLFKNKEEKYWVDRSYAESVAAKATDFTVSAVERKKRDRKAYAGFTTSTLQQAASSALKFKPKKTMDVAQQLFEGAGNSGHGLITYHRTDSPNMSDEAIAELWGHLRGEGMGDYIPAVKNVWKAKAGSQEAHECIRPTHFDVRHPDGLNADQAKLYDLIWKRAVASQMKPQVLDDTLIELLTNEINGIPQRFTARGSVELFDGWTRVYSGKDDFSAKEKDQEDDAQDLPVLKNGQHLRPEKVELQKKNTQPPSRYTEAALVKKLEDEGIGRPSTYAAIMETLHYRQYVTDEKGKLVPTQTAFVVVDALSGRFRFADLGYTRAIEAELDNIIEGKAEYLTVVAGVDHQLDDELAALRGDSSLVGEQHPCSREGCTGILRRRTGKKGAFWGCSNYPNCDETRPDEDGKPGEKKEFAASGFVCPECGKSLRRLQATKGSNKGKSFWGCTGFSDGCRFTAEDAKGSPVLEAVAV